MSNNIKKVIVGVSLSASALLLSACGESGNPMLEKGVPESIASYIQHPYFFDEADKLCVKNYSDPEKYGPISQSCKKWITNEFELYSGDLRHMYKNPPPNEILPSKAPTLKEFEDPKMWKIINIIINGKK